MLFFVINLARRMLHHSDPTRKRIEKKRACKEFNENCALEGGGGQRCVCTDHFGLISCSFHRDGLQL